MAPSRGGEPPTPSATTMHAARQGGYNLSSPCLLLWPQMEPQRVTTAGREPPPGLGKLRPLSTRLQNVLLTAGAPPTQGGWRGWGGRGKGSQSQLEGCPWSPCHLEGRECTSVRQDNCTGPDLDRRKLVGGVCPHKVSSPLKHWDSHCQQFHPGPGVHSPSGTGHLDPRQLWELRVASREQAEAGPAASPALSCRQRSQHPRPTARTGYQSLDA